jgi:hypothetical protein
MSVPFDRLYTFLRDVSDHDDILIYRWHPAGSRKLEDCAPLVPRPESILDRYTAKYLVCHDQEPLRFNDWPNPEFQQPGVDAPYSKLMTVLRTYWTVWDRVLLCHSELNSQELQKFEQDGAIGVYWWSHAMIARDWFRYAEHDRSLLRPRHIQQPFLIYNRAWSGTREYRLTFMDQLITQGLLPHCKTSMSFEDNVHYSAHSFQNPALAVQRKDFESHITQNIHPSTASADYCSTDYENTAVEIVLETLFDDARLHLTEKILRPIACSQPFMTLAPAGTLKLLQRYGFKTFADVWDESYDCITDPVQRMQAVLKNMKHIASLDQSQLIQLRQRCQAAVEHNQQWFFSSQFFHNIVQEFQTNLAQACDQLSQQCKAAHLKQFVNRGLSAVPQQDLDAVWQWLNQRAS